MRIQRLNQGRRRGIFVAPRQQDSLIFASGTFEFLAQFPEFALRPWPDPFIQVYLEWAVM